MNTPSPNAPFSPYRESLWSVRGQSLVLCGPGACDPTLRFSASGLKLFRYGTGCLRGTIAAAGSNIIFADEESCIIGAEGVGDTALTSANLWVAGDTSWTDLERSGAPSSRAYFFLLFGLAMSVNDAFQRGGTGAAATDPVFFSNWLLPEFGYQQYLIKLVMNYAAVSVQTDETGCVQRLGKICHMPQIGGPRGDQTIGNGLTAVPGMYTPFNTAYLMGPKDESQTKVTIKLTSPFTVQNNPVSPTVVAVNDASLGTVHVPIGCMFIGQLTCVNFGNWCDQAAWMSEARAASGGAFVAPPL